MNSVVLIGRCSRDIELKFIPSSGMAVTKLSLAVDREMSKDKKQEAQAQGKQTADFINITIFGKQAENAANYLTKGSQCAIHGRINTSNYTKDDGTKVYQTDVIADRVEFIGSIGQAKKDEDVFQPTNDNPFEDEDLENSIPF